MEIETNVIYCGDCLVKLRDIPSESVDLIYIDPPFSSNRNYVAFWQEQEKRHFEDRFENVRVYLDYMKPRVEQLYRVLKSTGSFYYHCDWHASHYIKVLLDSDYLFGYSNFQNEIIWAYRRWPSKSKAYQRFHDVILYYAKDKGQHTFNTLYQDIADITMKIHKGKKQQALVIDGHRWSKDSSEKAEETPIGDDWYISTIAGHAHERQGYPTQKPEALLERIVRASSNKGDIVLDAFCGCGTTLVVAQREKRKWIGIDISPTACRVMAKRLEDSFYMKEGKDFWVRDLPKTVEELRQYPPFEFQNWAINAVGGKPSKVKVRDGGIDGKLYPVEDIKKEKTEGLDLFGDIDRYIPIQTKRTEQVGRPDIENFEVAMKRDKRDKGIFVGFDFSRDALHEIRRAEREEGLEIEPITVAQIVEQELDRQLK
jgi:DNA modification methylase